MEKTILQKVTNARARLVGPNCMGVINTFEDVSLNATFVAEKPEIGETGILFAKRGDCRRSLKFTERNRHSLWTYDKHWKQSRCF